MHLIDHSHLTEVKLLLYNLIRHGRPHPSEKFESRIVCESLVVWLGELIEYLHYTFHVSL